MKKGGGERATKDGGVDGERSVWFLTWRADLLPY